MLLKRLTQARWRAKASPHLITRTSSRQTFRINLVPVKPNSRPRVPWPAALRASVLVVVFTLAGACLSVHDGWFWAQGMVVDSEGRPVPGASVTVRNQSAVTDRHGCFQIHEITSPDKHAMPFSVDALGSKTFIGTVAAPGALRVRIVLADATSAAGTVVASSPAPGALLSCEPPRIEPWVRESSAQAAGSMLITALSELPAHLGEYPCRSGLLESPVLRTALRDVLANDYEDYLKYVERSGCSPVAQRGSWILLEVSQVYYREGGGTSFILVEPQSARVYVLWLPWHWSGRKAKVYGSRPVPRGVSSMIVDELTSSRGDVETFSWRDGAVQVEPRNDIPLSIIERPQLVEEVRPLLQMPFTHSAPCPPDRESPATVRAALGRLADRMVIHRYDKSRWPELTAVARAVSQIVDAVPENGRLHHFQVLSKPVRPLIAASVEFKDLEVRPIEFAPGYVHLVGEGDCEWWGRYPKLIR